MRDAFEGRDNNGCEMKGIDDVVEDPDYKWSINYSNSPSRLVCFCP